MRRKKANGEKEKSGVAGVKKKDEKKLKKSVDKGRGKCYHTQAASNERPAGSERETANAGLS